MGNGSNNKKKKKQEKKGSTSSLLSPLWLAKAGLYSVGGLAAMSGLYIASRWWDHNHPNDDDGSSSNGVEPAPGPLPSAPLEARTRGEFERQAFVAQNEPMLRKLMEEVLIANIATERTRQTINRTPLWMFFEPEAHQSNEGGGTFRFNPEAFKRAVQDSI